MISIQYLSEGERHRRHKKHISEGGVQIKDPPPPAMLTALGSDEKKKVMQTTRTPKVQSGKTTKSITSANVEGEMIMLMKMKNSVEQDLKFAKQRSNGGACAIKYPFIPLLPDYTDQNTKRSMPHPAIRIVATPAKPPHSIANGRHAS